MLQSHKVNSKQCESRSEKPADRDLHSLQGKRNTGSASKGLPLLSFRIKLFSLAILKSTYG